MKINNSPVPTSARAVFLFEFHQCVDVMNRDAVITFIASECLLYIFNLRVEGGQRGVIEGDIRRQDLSRFLRHDDFRMIVVRCLYLILRDSDSPVGSLAEISVRHYEYRAARPAFEDVKQVRQRVVIIPCIKESRRFSARAVIKIGNNDREGDIAVLQLSNGSSY